jgi:ACR3 family arsenite efflux pump ArsB
MEQPMIVLRIAVPLLFWFGIAWFCSDGLKHMKEFWYVIILPFALVATVTVLFGIILFLHWLY